MWVRIKFMIPRRLSSFCWTDIVFGISCYTTDMSKFLAVLIPLLVIHNGSINICFPFSFISSMLSVLEFSHVLILGKNVDDCMQI